MNPAVIVAKPTSPYRGIHPFRYADRAYFCGRNDLIKELESNVFLHRLVVLFGKSGAGKSSVVNAGLVPFLEKEGLRCERLRIGISPDSPIQVERIVGDNDVLQPSIFDQSEEANPARFEQKIPLSMETFLSRVNTFAELNPNISKPTLTLIFDQFEELFTRFEFAKINSGPDKKPWQRRLTDTIVTLATEGSRHLRLLLVIREDFLADLEVMARDYPRVMDYRVRLNYLTGPEAISAILDPLVDANAKINRFSCVIDPTLAEDIVKDIARAQGLSSTGEKGFNKTVSEHHVSHNGTDLTEEAAIPPTQVQIVCSELWDSYADKMHSIGLDQYHNEKGGLQGILDSWFESQLLKLDKVDPRLRRTAIILLQNLITDLETRDVVSGKRLRDLVLPKGVLESDFLAALNHLTDDLHLVETSSQRGTHFYEVASEYLIASIRSKGNELERKEAAEKAAMAAREAAEKQAQQEKETAERAAREAQEATERAAKKAKEDAERLAHDLEVRHLQEMAAVANEKAETQWRLAEEQSQRAEEKAAAARKMKRLMLALAVLFPVSVILLLLYAFNWYTFNFRLLQSQKLAYQAYEHQGDNPPLSVKLALESVYIIWKTGHQPLPEVVAAMESSVAKNRVLPTGPVKAISISGDLRHVAVVDEFGKLSVNEAVEQSNIYSAGTPVPTEPQKISSCPPEPPVRVASFSGDAKASAASHQATLMEATWLRPLVTFYAANVALGPIFFKGNDGQYRSVASPKPVFSHDGQYLAFTQSGHEQDVVLWTMEPAQKTGSSQSCKMDFLHGSAKVSSLSFSSPDSGLLAVGGLDGTVKLWNIRAAHPQREWEVPDTRNDAVVALALSPNAKRLAIATTDGAGGKVALWDIEKKAKLGVLEGLNTTVSAMIFSSNGMLLATAENSPYDGSQPPITAEKPSEEKSIKVWSADTQKLRNTLLLSPGVFKTVSFSSNGKMLAAASQNGASSFVKVWNIEKNDPDGVHARNSVYKVTTPMESISGVALNEDGYQFLTSADGGTLTRHFLLLEDQIKRAIHDTKAFTPDECKDYIKEYVQDSDPDCNDLYRNTKFRDAKFNSPDKELQSDSLRKD
jgi:WD40 repeat protein